MRIVLPVAALTRLPLLLIMACGVLNSGQCPAAEGTQNTALTETEEDFTGDIDSVISATRIRQPLTESPSSVTIIDRDMISASGAVEVADVLRLVPGIQVGYPQGNQLAVTYHGFGDAFPRSMQVLIDGRSVYQPSFADVDWVFLGIVLDDIERIEVIRGPNSPLYGSNAVAGVINIITRLPLQDRGTLARATVGDLDTRDMVLRHGGKAGDIDYRLTLNYQANTGLEGNYDSTNDSRELGSGNLRATWYPHPDDEIDLQLGYATGDLGAGTQVATDPVPHDKQVSSEYEFVSWRHTLPDRADLRWQFNHNAYNSDDNYRDTISHAFGYPDAAVQFLLGVGPNEMVNLGVYDYEGERYDTELQYTSPAGGKLQTVAGIGLRMNRLYSPRLTNRTDWIDETSERAFVNLNYRATEKLLLNFGAMAENSDEFGSYISPRLAANWLFNDNQSMRFSITRAVRNPSLVESNFNTLQKLDDGTPYLVSYLSDPLEPETLTSAELGLVSYWLQRRLLLDAKAFWERTDHMIHFVDDSSLSQPYTGNSPPIAVTMNDGNRIAQGVELQLKYQVAPRDFVSFAISQVDSSVLYRSGINPEVRKFNQEEAIPRYTASLLASKSLPDGFEVSGAVYRLSRMIWLGSGDRLPGYYRGDVRVARRWRAGSSHVMLEAIGQNIGDEYLTFRKQNTFDTRGYLRLTVEFD